MRAFISRLLDLILRRRREDRLSEEVQAHLDMLTDEHIARGLSPDDARLAARKSFGGVDQVKMRYRDQRGWPVIDALLQDVRFAVRVLTRDRGFAVTAIVVLGFGIGVNNLFFTLVYAHQFRGLPIERPDRVLSVSMFDDRAPERLVSLADLEDIRGEQRAFLGLAAHAGGVVTVGDEGRAPDRFDAAYLSANALELIGVKPLAGRGPEPQEDRPGAAPVVMLGAQAWQNRYGRDPAIIGRSILIDGAPATVVGIIPDRSGFPSTGAVWMPLGQLPGLANHKRDTRNLRVFGRLRDEATESDARGEIEAIVGRLEASHPDTNRSVRARVMPINQRLLGTVNDGWMPFIVAGVIVILVACANVANLMMARAMRRSPEIAIRTSLGASRGRLIVQMLVEAMVLAAIGGALGGVLSVIGVRLFQSAIPDGMLPYWLDYSMDGRVFAGLVLISLATAIVFGLVPAVQASRTDVNRTLKDGGRSNMGRSGMRIWTTVFLTAEIALAMIMLTQVAIASVTSRPDLPTDAAINTTAVLTTTITLPTAAYPTANDREGFFQRLNERLNGRGGVTSVSRTTLLPGDGGPPRSVSIEGRPVAEGTTPPTVTVVDVAPQYFATLDVALLNGREFTPSDGNAGEPAAIVNQRFAVKFLNGREVMGSRIAIAAPNAAAATPPQWLTIVGVAAQIRQQGPGGVGQEEPVVYAPIAAASPATSILMVRHGADAATLAAFVRGEAQAVDSNVALYRMRTLASALHDAQWNRRVSSYLASTVCLLSVLLAVVGLYAVTAQRVTLKTQEIGLRMALGARSLDVARLIFHGLRVPLIAGLLLGTAGAVAWDRAFSPEVAGVYASAPGKLLTIAALILVVILIACAVPLRRATRLSPVRALRHD